MERSRSHRGEGLAELETRALLLKLAGLGQADTNEFTQTYDYEEKSVENSRHRVKRRGRKPTPSEKEVVIFRVERLILPTRSSRLTSV